MTSTRSLAACWIGSMKPAAKPNAKKTPRCLNMRMPSDIGIANLKTPVASVSAPDTSYDRHRQHALMFCAAWPLALVYIAPDLFSTFWLGVPLGFGSVLQFLWLPDAYAEWRARKK